jgi:hypothetical protein
VAQHNEKQEDDDEGKEHEKGKSSRYRRNWESVMRQSLRRAPHAKYCIVETVRTRRGSRGSSQSSRGSSREGSGDVSAGVSVSIDPGLLKLVGSCETDLGKAAAERRRKGEARGEVDQQSRWVQFMKWATHLQGEDYSGETGPAGSD